MPPSRRYKPGTRSANFRDERISKDRYAWLRTFLGQYIILWREINEEEPEREAITPTVQLLMTRPGGRPLSLNLTSLTREELDKTRQFFNMACDLAEPLVDIRDKAAEDAANQGDDSYIRSYRQVPELIIRSRTVGPDREVLRERSESDAGGAGDSVDLDGGVRGHSDGVAPGTPERSGSEDDEPSTD